MPISVAPRQPRLLTVDQRCPSAEMSVTRSKQKKSITFCEIVSIRSTTHVNDMTDEEVENAWFSRREMTGIKRRMALEVKEMSLGREVRPDSTRRGLEYRTREGSDRRRSNKLTSIHAVLDEQDLQHMRGANEPEGLRRVYLKHSTHCADEARQLGKADELEIIKHLKEAFEEKEDDESETRSSKKENKFLRLFAKKRAVVEEIKQMRINATNA